ncbi:MAG: efflux transporter outer membrane subunit [Syntrophorhabdaceae bacterium]|nr:efflux transporter outer membrane subunit [Syntrophorhabdaceae bacterium]
MMTRIILYGVILLSLLSGCTMAPKYTRPEAPIPHEWPKGEAYKDISSQTDSPLAELRWQDFITDEKLLKVIEIALTNNRDLRIAALNAERAMAYYNIKRAELLPALDATGTGTRQRVPADLSSRKVTGVAEQYSVNLGLLSWEIDFFGRIRSLKDAALEEYLATEETHQSARIMIVANTAMAYLIYAADMESLSTAKATFKAQKDTYDLIKRRYNVGLASEIDLRRAQTQVDTAIKNVSQYTQLVAHDKNMLNLIAGRDLPEELLPEGLEGVVPPKDVPPGLSSEILLRRPDVMASEHRLKALNATIGAARAAFFPRIALTTTIGTASAELSNLVRSGQQTWSFSPQVLMPVFDARIWAAYEAAKVEREIAIANYEKTIQTAFKEVADALAVKGTIDEQLSAQRSLVEAASETYRLATLRYEKGIDNYLSVLDAQRSLYGAQQGLIGVRLAALTNKVTLYRVLGGDYYSGDRARPSQNASR